MSNKIGRFEILSEITRSETASVYKASDPESGQTIALKTLRLDVLQGDAAVLVQQVLEEVGRAKPLNSHNIAQVYGAEEMDGQFCAAMEYVQGNSITTMLARKEGFSIWDLQDIARQTCQGLDHAHVHNVAHYSVEPAKIMVTWDGTVKVLGFGISIMGAGAAYAADKAPEVLHYMSPEQLRGDPVGAPSNLFSLGAILYEMVTEHKAFPGEAADQVRQQILEQMPPPPEKINRKVHPALSEVIMKALSKAPEERYQSGQELVNDLERCKESSTKAAAKPAPPQVPKVQKSAPPAAAPGGDPSLPAKKAAAVAAGWEGAGASLTTAAGPSMGASVGAIAAEGATMSAAKAAPPEVTAPRLPVDPMMDEGNKVARPQGRSFSEIDELPPLKEVYVAPPPPMAEPEVSHPSPASALKKAPLEKPKVQPREAAKKAVREIRKTPPKLFMYSIAAAVGVILLVVVGIAFHIHSENSEESAPAQASATTSAHPDVGTTQAAAQIPAKQTPPPSQAATPEVVAAQPEAVSVKPKYNNKRKPKPQPAVVVPGQLTINSTPEGAQVQVDGRNDPGWVTPFNLTGLAPGQHTVSISRAGYAPENRVIDVASGSKSFLVVQLAQLAATVSVASEPAGAAVFIDGKDTGRLTPAQISVDKPGSHTLLVRKQGYLEETTTVNLQAGQAFRLAPTLRALGTTDDIKMGGKFKKMFGGRETAAMGTVSIKTQPKGAQIAVNRRVLDKVSPVEFYLNPGTYVIDVTISGYKILHRVINVEKGGKVAIDESLERE
jgi:eukaryotic-like serine/threonine-protein kinase